jgi:hypothetical protein
LHREEGKGNGQATREWEKTGEPPRGTKGVRLLWKRLIKTTKIKNIKFFLAVINFY